MFRQSLKMLLPFLILLLLHSSLQQASSGTQANPPNSGAVSLTSSNSSSSVVVTTSTNSTNNSANSSTDPWPAPVNEWLQSKYKYAAFIFVQTDVRLNLRLWRTLFSQAQQQLPAGSQFNFTECSTFVTSKQQMKCDSSSTTIAQSAVIMNLHLALTLKPEERTQVCVSFKESVKMLKNIAAECQKESPENWQQYNEAKFLQHLVLQHVDGFKTMQHLLCTPYSDSREVTVPVGSCDKDKIRDYLLAFVRITLSVNNGAGCGDVSLAIKAVVSALELCPYETRSALSPFVASMQNTRLTMCTTRTCNIAYVDSLTSETLQLLKDTDQSTSALSPVVIEGICSLLKTVLAISTNHTIDCSRSVYDSVSMQINSVLDEHVKRCGKLPLEPKPCVRTALNPHDIIWGLGKSFFSSKETVCQAATKFQVKDKVIDSYCTGSAPKPEDVTSCLLRAITTKSSPCERTAWIIIEQLQNAPVCLYSVGTNDMNIKKAASFLQHLQEAIPFGSKSPVCAADDKFEQLMFNATISILTGDKDPVFCLTVQVVIDQWFTQCGNSKLDKNNITALFSLVCPKSLQLPAGCSFTGSSTCFSTAWLTSDAVQISAGKQCVQTASVNCSGSILLEVQEAFKYLEAAAETLSPHINDSNCVCDPPAAVNCIMEVHHLFKQQTPDFQGLCPKVPESETCARSYLQGCEECKKTTVLNIVHKLNSQLEQTCLNPPMTLCPAISAMKCVTDLEDLLASSQTISNDTICIEITIARRCVYNKTEHCDDLTALTIEKKLEYTISKIKNLDCKPPEVQLKVCGDVFNASVQKILATNKDACLIALQNNDKTLWDALTAQCAELDVSFSCIDATLGLLVDVGAVIVRKTIHAVYETVKKVCKPPPPQLQCYSFDADVKDSFTKITTTAVKTCNETEICVTTTSVNPNGTSVKHKGCSSRTDCNPGCDQKGCTYCCSENLCNNQDNGPTYTCDVVAAAACALHLSRGYIHDDNFKCSSVDVLAKCIKDEKKRCEILGTSAQIDALANLNLEAEKQQCFIEEANLTCSVQQFAAIFNYVTQNCRCQIGTERLCWIVADSRNKVKRAEDHCTKDQTAAIKHTQARLEAAIGKLDCAKNNTNNTVTINNACKPTDALLCQNKVLGNADIKTNVTCQSLADIAACMKPLLVNCSSPTQLLLVDNQMNSLKSFLPANTNCLNVTLVENQNPAMNPVTDCLHLFLAAVQSDCICTFFKKIKELQSCISDIKKEDILALGAPEKLELGVILKTIDNIKVIELEGNITLTLTASLPCTQHLNTVFYKHAAALFGIGLLPSDQRDIVCKGLDDDLAAMTSTCGINETVDIYKLMDKLRLQLNSYCPEIKPIPRCLLHFAEELFRRFTASIGPFTKANLCLEADIYIESALKYIQPCAKQDLATIRKQATVVADIVLQRCAHLPKLIAVVRCGILGHVDVQPGCVTNAASGCTTMPSDSCSAIETKASCITRNAGKCLGQVPQTDLTDTLNKISNCWYGDASHSTDNTTLSESCSSRTYPCNITQSKGCLTSIGGKTDVSSLSQAKQCLDGSYYCFMSVPALININSTGFASSEAFLQAISPHFEKLESPVTRAMLTLPTTCGGILTNNPVLSLNAWDICLALAKYVYGIDDTFYRYPFAIFPALNESRENVIRTIKEYCSDVESGLQIPPNKTEEPDCPVETVTFFMSTIAMRLTFDLSSMENAGIESICSLFSQWKQFVEASGQLSLQKCTDGFKAKFSFAYKVVSSVLGTKCQKPDYDIRRCAYDKVVSCISTLLDNIMLVGENQTYPGLCKIFEETKACVEKNSYNCDSCTQSSIQYMFDSVKLLPENKCKSQDLPLPECKDESKPMKCDIPAVTACSAVQLANIATPFKDVADNCRALNKYLLCINEATGGCTAGTSLEKVHQEINSTNTILAKLSCKDENPTNSSGCKDGCWLNKASECFEVFKQKISHTNVTEEQQTDCWHRNQLSVCVAENTKSCSESVAKSFLQNLDAVLLQSRETGDACSDPLQITKDFCYTAGEILNCNKVNDDPDHDDDDNDDDDDHHNSGGENNSSSPQSLYSLWLIHKKSWDDMQKLFQTFNEDKKFILDTLSKEIFKLTQAKCSDTKALECYHCDNKDSVADCEAKTEICPINLACMFRQSYVNSTVKYSAGCTSTTKCKTDSSSEKTLLCSSRLCNKKANAGNKCDLQPANCKQERALKCALNLVKSYTVSDTLNCSSAVSNLQCMQKYSVGCNNTMDLSMVASILHLRLARTSCVVNAGPNDNLPSTLKLALRELKNPYINEGNTVCLSQQEKISSFNALIASGTCSPNATVSVKVALDVITSVVGTYCNNKCDQEITDVPTQATQYCSWRAFDGIKKVYTCGAEVAKTDGDCGIAAANSLAARQALKKCHIPDYVYETLNALDSTMKDKCQQPTLTPLPEVCSNLCQSAVVLNFVDEVKVAIKTNPTYSLWYLINVRVIYIKYTAGCTSIQQSDVVNYIYSKLGIDIEEYQNKNTDFMFEFEMKADIYHQAVLCSLNFQKAIRLALDKDDKTIACRAGKQLDACELNLPDLVIEYVISLPRDISASLELQNMCAGVLNETTVRTKRDASACNKGRWSELVGLLTGEHNFEIAAVDIRKMLCQNLDASIEEAKKITEECIRSKELSQFRTDLYNSVIPKVETRREKYCIPPHYEKDQCDLKRIKECWNDFIAVSGCAGLKINETLCRVAKFTLECTQRFTTNCTTDADKAKVTAIWEKTLTILKGTLGNNCPELTGIFYCNASVTSHILACRLEEAQTISKEISFDGFKINDDPKYCQDLKKNVSNAQSAAYGCDDDQIKSINWPSANDGFCNITDVSLNNVCRSLPLCLIKPFIACFNQSNQTCQSLGAAFACLSKYESSHKQCQQYLGSFLVQKYFSVYQETLAHRCNIQYNIPVPQLAGVEKLVATVNMALGYNKPTATATDILNHIFNTTAASLEPDDPVGILMLAILNKVAITSSVKPVEYNNQTDTRYTDKDNCYLTRAKACIEQQILQMCLIKMLSMDDIDMILSNWNVNHMDVCVKDAVSGCSPEDKNKFLQISSVISTIFAALEICEKPNVCLVSEAYHCNNDLMTKIKAYEANKNMEDVCLERFNAQACLNSYLSKCSADKAKPARDDFMKLSDELDNICKDFVNPEPPLCPSIRGGERVCSIGIAFSCLANSQIKIFSTATDLFTLRDQCLGMQKMMVCIAKQITSCDSKNQDVKIILASVKQLKASFVNACPYLTEDFCSIQTDCPVMRAGCDTEMERQLINNQIPVCNIKQAADACVDNYTTTCTQAQKVQASSVINKKMALLGLPKDMSCQAGSIDSCLISLLAAAREIYRNSNVRQNCGLLASQYTCIQSSYPNVAQSLYLDLGKDLIDKLKTITTASQCSATVNSTCTNLALVNKLTSLIEQLVLNTNFSDIAFCAKSQDILRERKTNDCNVALFDAITNSMAYKQKCANEKITCEAAAVSVQECIKKIGVFSVLSCADKQKAANCITMNLPSYCSYNSSWLDGTFCNETLVLQVLSDLGKKNFISESGLCLKVTLKIVAGGISSRQITVKMTAQAKNDSSTPSSEVNDQTPKVYTNKNPQRLQDGSSEFTFTICAIQDYRTGGHRTVIAQFIVTPFQLTTDPVTGQKVETAMNNMSFTALTFIIYVEDATPLHFICSSLNDPHFKTGDHAAYDNMVSGIYILYRHLIELAAVVIETYQCSSYGGTCNCAMSVFAGKSYFKFSVCTGAAYITFKSEKESATSENQEMIVFLEKNRQKIHVILLRTGTFITVINQGNYLQVIVILSARDIFFVQGLCGNFNGKGIDDFEMRNGTTLILTKADTLHGVVNPAAFVEDWRLSSEDAVNALRVYAPTAMPSDVLEPACYCWINGSTEVCKCSKTAPFQLSGFISGTDETDSMLALANQDSSTASKKRKKRQVVFEDQPSNNTVRVNLSQPVWNQSEATDFCMDNLFYAPLRACRDAILSLNDSRYLTAFDRPLDMCVQDLQLTGDTMWLEASREAAKQECLLIISQNPQLPSNLAAAFLNMRCDPFDCNGHGNCSNGVCLCDSSYAGTKCDVPVSDLHKQPYLTLNEDDEAYLCEITFVSNCSSVFVSGGNFVSSDFLACHIRELEITETGVKTQAPGEVTTVKGELITTNQVKCDLGIQSHIMRSVEVSVSNDGKTPYEKYQTFIAFDPVCYDCNLYSCKKKKNVCIIGNRCVAEGQTSVYSDCQYCNLSSPNTWSIRLDKPECEYLIPKPVGDDTDKQTLTTALIAVGCSAVILVIILVTVCCIMKRRQNGRRRRSAQTDGTDNPSFHDMPFTGKPIPAYKPRQWADSNVSPPSYNQYA